MFYLTKKHLILDAEKSSSLLKFCLKEFKDVTVVDYVLSTPPKCQPINLIIPNTGSRYVFFIHFISHMSNFYVHGALCVIDRLKKHFLYVSSTDRETFLGYFKSSIGDFRRFAKVEQLNLPQHDNWSCSYRACFYGIKTGNPELF